ncbi:hypothetical protein N7539_000154 [Penicillium diatomitis]|uniref:Uncharacterized protein n=1 Tax=Penicillium diatomitis TaxID=2819901 RepID=A0A9X0C1X2_9EURO|nr:uncharacterized protein N7539_000154 [Penicillium diatomitis]KAJ5495038.1 hypothetical protein N7539_000154 [Penicillium diatomitis]
MVNPALAQVIIGVSGRIPGHTHIHFALTENRCQIVNINWFLDSAQLNRPLRTAAYLLVASANVAEDLQGPNVPRSNLQIHHEKLITFVDKRCKNGDTIARNEDLDETQPSYWVSTRRIQLLHDFGLKTWFTWVHDECPDTTAMEFRGNGDLDSAKWEFGRAFEECKLAELPLEPARDLQSQQLLPGVERLIKLLFWPDYGIIPFYNHMFVGRFGSGFLKTDGATLRISFDYLTELVEHLAGPSLGPGAPRSSSMMLQSRIATLLKQNYLRLLRIAKRSVPGPEVIDFQWAKHKFQNIELSSSSLHSLP